MTKERMTPFTCHGRGARKKPDGTPQNHAFVWTHEATKKKHSYCYECDGKLIQDVPLPRPRQASRDGRR